MQERKTRSGLVVAALIAAAIGAPVATAMPAVDTYKPSTAQDLRGEASTEQPGTPVSPQTQTPAAQLDMHASTVQKPAPEKQDLRSEAAADPTRAPAPPVGLPTWPLDPRPLAPPVAQQPVADGDGGGVDWQVPGLAIVGSLLLIGGLVIAGARYRTRTAG
jgi:hypothetical protein